MADHDEGLTRRDFLREAGFAALAGLAGWKALNAAEGPRFSASRPKATVVLIRDQAAVRANGSIDAQVAQRMIFEGVQSLTGEKRAGAAWRKLFRPSDVVGIKFSRCGYMRVPTSQEVVDGVAAGLRLASVSEEHIHSADYGLPAAECMALVNVSSLKAHPLAGFAAAIKNYINFHPKPDQYHHRANSKLPEVWLRPEVKGKTRLIVLDLIIPYFGTGPQIDPRYKADYRGILLATDPVAADTVALALCQKLRGQHRGKPWPLNPPPLFLAAADRDYHLGTSDPNSIRLVRMGWTKGMLI
jgi:hypothetical protein